MAKPDDAAFDEFVSSAWRPLRQAAFALTGNTADAEDLLQTVLVRTYARWPRVGRDDAVAYVRRALVNAYVDTWRRRQVLRFDPVDELPEVASYDADSRVDDRADLAERLAEPVAARADDGGDASLLRPFRAGRRAGDGLLGRHGQEHLLAGTATTPDPCHDCRGAVMTSERFKDELDRLDSGLPDHPDTSTYKREGRAVRRRRQGAGRPGRRCAGGRRGRARGPVGRGYGDERPDRRRRLRSERRSRPPSRTRTARARGPVLRDRHAGAASRRPSRGRPSTASTSTTTRARRTESSSGLSRPHPTGPTSTPGASTSRWRACSSSTSPPSGSTAEPRMHWCSDQGLRDREELRHPGHGRRLPLGASRRDPRAGRARRRLGQAGRGRLPANADRRTCR